MSLRTLAVGGLLLLLCSCGTRLTPPPPPDTQSSTVDELRQACSHLDDDGIAAEMSLITSWRDDGFTKSDALNAATDRCCEECVSPADFRCLLCATAIIDEVYGSN